MCAVPQQVVGRAELLKMLSVSPTRLVQLTTLPEHGFPAPAFELAMGKIWDLADVQAWAERKGRTLAALAAPDDGAGDA